LSLDTDIQERLTGVRARLEHAARRARRDPAGVRLLAVSKTFGIDAIRAAFEAGQLDFGENRVQEALQKMGASSDLQIRWHLIGPLQSNKVKKASAHFAWIHSVDSVDLLEQIDAAAGKAGASPALLVQVDLAGEPTKHGAPLAAARDVFRAALRCGAARLVGLMVLPPYFEDPEGARPYFRRLREIRDTLRDEGTDPALLQELSMGMSHDFEVAVEEGATIVRIGTAIFGGRQL
jgi:pyridoxal phosphate enzyme (YggS family)